MLIESKIWTAVDKQERFEVDYYLTKDGAQAHRVRVWVDVLDKWIDVSLDYASIENDVNQLIVTHMWSPERTH